MTASGDIAGSKQPATPDLMSVMVRVKRGIRPDGEIELVTIQQGDAELRLTEQQATTLYRVLKAKLGTWRD